MKIDAIRLDPNDPEAMTRCDYCNDLITPFDAFGFVYEHNGNIYRFCGDDCRLAFIKDREQDEMED
jgi:ribosomal protein L24E